MTDSDKSKVSYTIHIAGTPEIVWAALTDPDILRQNWGIIHSQWTQGAAVAEVSDAGKVLWEGQVLRSEAPSRLSFTFDVPGSGEPPTEVSFELSPPLSPLAPGARVVRLTVTQAGFEESSKLQAGCARAWTEILSSLKSHVETGRPLGFSWR